MEWLATKLGCPNVPWLIGSIVISIAMWLFVFAWRSVRADRNHWRKRAKAAHGHLAEVDDAIGARCKAFRKGMHWCDRYDCFAECNSCFVQGQDEVGAKEVE